MRATRFPVGPVLGLALLANSAPAQVTVTDTFTGAVSQNQWYYYGGACLTAGTTTTVNTAGTAGYIPSCATLALAGNYYNTFKTNVNFPRNPLNTNNPYQPLLGGNTGLLPDTLTGGGALRFTNAPSVGGAAGYPDGLFERGVIVSTITTSLSAGLQIKFTTETYDPPVCTSNGTTYNQCPGGPYAGTDGADGISFFLQDASQLVDFGGLGGSLNYSCSDVSGNADPTVRNTGPSSGHQRGNDGLIGGYLGVGIDEAGYFMDGAVVFNPDGSLSASPRADNTATGFGLQPGVVGVRGAGSLAFSSLNAISNGKYYPTGLSDTARNRAVQQACTSAVAWDWTSGNSNPTPVSPTVPLSDYKAIIYSTIPGGQAISNLNANQRGVITPVTAAGYGIPISYILTITAPPASLLTLAYSYNGGAFQEVLTGQDIVKTIGALPAKLRYGFAGSMGGAQNTHEVMCFQTAAAPTVGSAGSTNVKQSAQVQTDSQVYLTKYNSMNWAGYLTSQYLTVDAGGNVAISPTVNWDASCVLTGGPCAATLAATGAAQTSRTILTWSGGAGVPAVAPFVPSGIPFEWGSLTSAEQAALNTGDSTTTQLRLNYLRGDQSQEQNSQGVGIYRARPSVLGDIIDSGSTWVGPPSAAYPVTWKDTLYPAASPPENSGTSSYAAFAASTPSGEGSRTNVVYAGANDGFLHGFETGSYASGVYNKATNDGKEVLAYMPGYVLNTIQTALPQDDYSALQYGHHFDVDAPPGTGDLYYNSSWHTWLVGGLGAGGSAIYALDITDSSNFSEGNASNVVLGEWSSSPGAATASFTCAGVANSSTTTALCGNNLGKTFGTPQIKRFHNGSWGVIVGNGFGSATGDAGVYVMLVDPSAGAKNMTIYYLGTGQSGKSDGIANATAADLDGDHVVDYIYAGDLLGNVWRFDVTSNTPSNWAVKTVGSTPTPIFTTGTGQPITSKVMVALVPSTPSTRVLVEFGTGQLTQFTNTAGPMYSSTQQYLYGIWDWNLAAWNANNSTQFGVLPITGFTAPAALSGLGSLQQQTTTSYSSTTDYRTVSSTAICWADTAACNSTRQYGWYLALGSGYETGNATTGPDVNFPTPAASGTVPSVPVFEQVIYNPLLVDGAFIVNTTIPSTNSVANCNPTLAGGWTMAINPATGGAFTKAFFNSTDTNTSLVTNGIALSGTGTSSIVNSGSKVFLVTQVVAGTGAAVQIFPAAGTSGNRLTWIQKR